MQPPRVRTPRINLGSTEVLRKVILNATACVTTLMLLRIATLLVPRSDEATAPALIQLVTQPLVWPFQFLPILGAEIVREVTVIDVLMTLGLCFLGLLVAGILTGWRDSANTARRYPTLRNEE